jgi:lipid-A-disaccharide synthase
MKPKSIMLVAGEASGDLLAAELVQSLRQVLASAEAIPTSDYQPLYTSLEPRFFGAGGPRMAAAGVDLAFDMTAHSVIGLSEALKKYFSFRRLFHRLFRLALEQEPDAIVCIDFAGFNLRFARAIRKYVASRADWFHDWAPKIVQYVSPQVWASRDGRTSHLARDYDLLLSIFPFEQEWYARRVPQLRVEFVGHPMLDRYRSAHAEHLLSPISHLPSSPLVLLLPGSRPGELRRHLPVLAETARRIVAMRPVRFCMILPNESLAAAARVLEIPQLAIQVGGLQQALQQADLALTKSGTITLECAFFGVPAVVFYKTSPVTYLVGKQLVKVKHLAMPNLLADETVFPEFIQSAATPENIARAALELLDDAARRNKVKARLGEIVSSLGLPGASQRAARAIAQLLTSSAGR